MIQYLKGNLLESDADALVNTVNTVGVMGKGIALQFKKMFPQNYKTYVKACKEKKIGIGLPLVTEEQTLINGKKTIINLPTKTDWRKPSEYLYIEKGLDALTTIIQQRHIRSIAIPPLGAGNGGLNWHKVKIMMEQSLASLDSEVYIYLPNYEVEESLKKERVSLTPAHAMLLAVLYDLVKNGEFVSEFSAEKIAYFLQRFGAESVLKLNFQPNFYGPYSGKVKHILHYLNGSYITGYSAKDRKPFEELGILLRTEEEVLSFLKNCNEGNYLHIVNQTKEFLNGFYSNYGLELLSTIDYIMHTFQVKENDKIIENLENWSNRKRTLFSNKKFVTIALQRFHEFKLI